MRARRTVAAVAAAAVIAAGPLIATTTPDPASGCTAPLTPVPDTWALTGCIDADTLARITR